MNPAISGRGSKYAVKPSKTPVLYADEVRNLLDCISESILWSAYETAH
jgi:hypothetical protein